MKKVYFSDLRKIVNRALYIFTNSTDIIPSPPEYEKAFIQPNIEVLYPEIKDILAVIVIFKDRIEDFDDLCITILHELIHLWLYMRDEYDHDEEFIENEAKRIYELERKNVKRLVNKYFKNINGGKNVID